MTTFKDQVSKQTSNLEDFELILTSQAAASAAAGCLWMPACFDTDLLLVFVCMLTTPESVTRLSLRPCTVLIGNELSAEKKNFLFSIFPSLFFSLPATSGFSLQNRDILLNEVKMRLVLSCIISNDIPCQFCAVRY